MVQELAAILHGPEVQQGLQAGNEEQRCPAEEVWNPRGDREHDAAAPAEAPKN